MDVELEQDKDDSNMDSLDLLMMLGYIAENTILELKKWITYPKIIILIRQRNLPKRLDIVEVIKISLNKTAVIVFGLHETGIDLAHKLRFQYTRSNLNPVFFIKGYVLTHYRWSSGCPLVIMADRERKGGNLKVPQDIHLV